MICTKCKATLDIVPAPTFCPYCGKKLTATKKRRVKSRGNGTGSAYYDAAHHYWIAKVVTGYHPAADLNKPMISIKKTKGGFKTREDALAYCPILKDGEKYKKPTITLKEVFDQWDPWYEPRVDKSTMAGYRAAFKYYGSLYNEPIINISAGDLQKCMDACPNGKRTHQNMKVVAGLVWKYARDKHIVSQVESENLYTGKGTSKKREALTDLDVQKIQNAIGAIRYAEYAFCMCYLGYRPGEMLELRKDQLIEHNGTLFLIEGKKTDAGRDRTVPVHQKIEDIVRARLMIPGTDLVFPQYVFDRPNKKNDQNPPLVAFKEMTDNYLRSMVFKPMMQQLGIAEGKVPYAARHTFSNKLKKAAGDAIDKAALMGHSSYTFTQTNYQSTDDDDRLAIVDSMD